MRNYTTMTPIEEPVEIRLGKPSGRTLVLWAWNDDGIIHARLSLEGNGMAESLTNLQAKAVFPRKAVMGWQKEVIEFAETSIYHVNEVR